MMRRIRAHVSYANVMATLALFVALGGTSYAVVKVTGRNVVDGSLTGKDIKRKSVPLNRLKGKLPTGKRGPQGIPGPQGPQGAQGAQGPPGPVDASQFLPSAGATTFAVGPSQWEFNSADMERQELATNRVDFRGLTSSGNVGVVLNPTLPATLAGKALRLKAVTLCVDATNPNATLDRVIVSQFRGPLAGGADAAVATFDDLTDQNDSVCRRYEMPEAFVLGPRDYITVLARVKWSAVGGEVQFSGTSFEFERTA